MADVTISDLPVLTAVEIADKADIRFVADDLQAVATTKQISLTELEDVLNIPTGITAITWAETALPATNAARGFYGVRSGANKGLYLCTGAERILLTEFSMDGVA